MFAQPNRSAKTDAPNTSAVLLVSSTADETVDDIRESALVLLADISRHRHRGADLIWESFNFDIGEGD